MAHTGGSGVFLGSAHERCIRADAIFSDASSHRHPARIGSASRGVSEADAGEWRGVRTRMCCRKIDGRPRVDTCLWDGAKVCDTCVHFVFVCW